MVNNIGTPVLFVMLLGPGIATIIIGEAALLRRDSLLKGERYRGVGQWSAFVCVFFAVLVSLLDKHVLEPMKQ